MKYRYLQPLVSIVGVVILAAATTASAAPSSFTWSTVVNNNDLMPGAPLNRTFNSYNQPSVNLKGLVVMRARSRGGGGQPATHGIYTRNMGVAGSPIVRILDRSTEVPQPNNLETLFVETPSFPRIDMSSDTIATRGNHQPVWRYFLPDGSETRGGTTGIYTNPFGPLITGAAKLGDVADFSFFEVPEFPGTRFEVFPGAPAVTQRDTIVFKGNYNEGLVGRTGVYFRQLRKKSIVLADGADLAPAGGDAPVVLIANSTDTLIPGTTTVFGSTSPPSAAGRWAVFAGFDNEAAPTLGGIYLASLAKKPQLTTLVRIGDQVPNQPVGDTFNGLGEGNAFDGRFVGFWGAWGAETRNVRLYCPTEGNQDRIAYCNKQLVCEDTGETLDDPNSICDGTGCYQDKQVPVHQGIFVHDTRLGRTRAMAKTGADFDEFLFWSYSGKTPCVGSGHGEEGGDDDGEPVRWRSSAFVAVSGLNDQIFSAVFKAVKGNVVGIYLDRGPGQPIETVLDTTMDGQMLDPEAPADSTITELGLEREGLRGNWLALSAKMGIEGGTEEEGMAGIYVTRVPNTPPR
ncbi:MAG: hypothetical protein AB7G75_20560 [Candidatus Binatia bacterium]